MNHITLVGRLCADPQLTYTPKNGLAIVKFTLAVERPRFDKNKPKEADFINCVMFGKRSETIANYVQKGHRFGVIGRLRINKYVDKKTNENRWSTNVVVSDFEFMQDKTGNGNSTQNIQQNNDGDGYTEVIGDEIPF